MLFWYLTIFSQINPYVNYRENDSKLFTENIFKMKNQHHPCRRWGKYIPTHIWIHMNLPFPVPINLVVSSTHEIYNVLMHLYNTYLYRNVSKWMRFCFTNSAWLLCDFIFWHWCANVDYVLNIYQSKYISINLIGLNVFQRVRFLNFCKHLVSAEIRNYSRMR